MSGEITERRYKNDQEIAADKQREDQLQTYLDRMPELLLNNQLSKLPPTVEARLIARARTLTVLSRLDGKRKASLLQFLYEMNLIGERMDIIPLQGADLRYGEFSQALLDKTDMSGVDLRFSDLRGADLRDANLLFTKLHNAKLKGTDLRFTNIHEAELDTDWYDAILTKEQKEQMLQISMKQISQKILNPNT